MKLAMFGWEFPPFISGGLGVHCFHLTKELAGLGVEIDFYMPYTGKNPKVPWMNIIEVDPFQLPDGKIFQFGPYSSTKTIIKEKQSGRKGISGMDLFSAVMTYNNSLAKLFLRNHQKKNYDLIACHDWITVEGAVEAKKLSGLPLVLTMHSTELDRTANLNPFDWILGIEKKGVASATRVITVSRRSAKRLEDELSCSNEKIDVVYNAVDPLLFKSRVKKEEFGFTDGIVLFHGRLSVQKGPEFFLQAAKLVLEEEKDARFVISGKGDMMPRLVNLAIDLNIADKVTFTGYLPEEQLADLYAVADVYVFPSVSEPFGITVLEAMASGTPVILSKTSGVAEIVDHVLKVDFWDTHQMASKIIALLRYSALRQLLATNAMSELTDITWRNTAITTLQTYEKTIRENKK